MLPALPHVARAQADSARASLARTEHFALSASLDARPGVFVYRFDAPGWPEIVSLDGLPPLYSVLRFGEVPFDDLVTGGARYDLVPLAWLDTLARSGEGGRAAQVVARLRSPDAPRPRTEIRYLSGPGGFQSVEAVHAQSRRRRLMGAEGQLNASFGYAGRAAENEYPNSRLRRGRATLLRLGFETERTAVEVFNLHTRAMLGAPNGVLPPDPADPGSIYDRFNASVRDRASRRQTIRNDTGVRLQRGAALATLYRSFERLRFSGDSLTTSRTARYGFTAQVFGRHRALELDGWWMRAAEPSATAGTSSRLYAAVRDTLGSLVLRAGMSYDGALRPAGDVQVRLPFARLHVEASSHTPPPLARGGFGVYARGSDPPAPYVVTGSAEAAVRHGGWRIAVRPFASVVLDGIDFAEERRDSLVVVHRSARRAGATLGLGWRESALKGAYARAQATLMFDLGGDAPSDLPLVTTGSRLGLRIDLFQRDLRLDVFARLRTWSAFDGRVLHDPTGLLVLPEAPMPVPASSTLDVTALAGVRGATLFLTYENALSGTALMRGNYLVPEQPLPEARLRFGVFWPIFD